MADLRAALGHMRETKDDFQAKGMSLLNPEHLSEFLPAKYYLIYFGICVSVCVSTVNVQNESTLADQHLSISFNCTSFLHRGFAKILYCQDLNDYNFYYMKTFYSPLSTTSSRRSQ